MNLSLYLRRRGRIALPEPQGREPLPLACVATVAKNVESLGYGFSPELIEACRRLSLDQLARLQGELAAALAQARGAHRVPRPMYPNFPEQVMETSLGELYVNAIVHYWSDGVLLPASEARKRFPLLDNVELTKIDLGSREEFESLFGQIAASNASLSEQDREDLAWFVSTYRDGIAPLLPAAIPQKENMAYLAGLLIAHTTRAEAFVRAYCRTATDVLRLAAAMSDGDASLARSTWFRSFTRAERRLLLGLIEAQANPTEEMLRWKGRWLRLGERLHPGEYRRAYPRVAESFSVLRGDLPYATFNAKVESALSKNDVAGALACLRRRAGELARRLDHLLRLDEGGRESALAAFSGAAGDVSTPVLLQVRQHFLGRSRPHKLRVFFPKGSLARAHAEENRLPDLPPGLCGRVVGICEEALTARFRARGPLGRVYVDEALASCVVPFSQRSASRSLRTLARGSKLPLPGNCRTLRFFVWWKNGRERTDIDLSAALFDGAFRYVDAVTYYNLKTLGGVHSGDIVDAPEGASEFIDLDLETVARQGVRYIVLSLYSFTSQPYVDLPECFAGWMAREEPGSGEIYEPKTVQDRLDLTADTQVAIPLVFDIVERKAIWADMSLRRNPNWINNLEENLGGVQLTLRSLTDLDRPNLYDLFALHARARGEMVDSPEDADTVFSVENGTPFRQERIASEFLA